MSNQTMAKIIAGIIAETDEAMTARALLVGMARLQILAAATPGAINAINQAAEMIDYRDELPESFCRAVDNGHIRINADWGEGRHTGLAGLIDSQLGGR